MKLYIHSTLPDHVVASAGQPSVADLSLEELRNTFSCRVRFIADGEEAIVLDDAPLLGVLVELSEAWLKLQTNEFADIVDFYGEYKLVLRKADGFIECENEFAGGRYRVSQGEFIAAVRSWAEELLRTTESKHGELEQSPAYLRLKQFVSKAWQTGVVQ